MKYTEKQIITALKQTGGNVSATARRLGADRSYLYDRILKSEKLTAELSNQRLARVQDAEDGLSEMLHCDNPIVRMQAIKYTLSTLGKNLGYTEKQEVDVSSSSGVQIVLGKDVNEL